MSKLRKDAPTMDRPLLKQVSVCHVHLDDSSSSDYPFVDIIVTVCFNNTTFFNGLCVENENKRKRFDMFVFVRCHVEHSSLMSQFLFNAFMMHQE